MSDERKPVLADLENKRLIDEVMRRLQLFEHKANQLDEIYATLVVNFVDKKTHGVQVNMHGDHSPHQLMMEVIRSLGAAIETEG